MRSSAASYSILAKTKAKYGQRLTVKNLKEISGLSSVADVALYLKTKTHYSSILSNTEGSAIHRGNLEKLIYNKYLKEIYNLCRFEKSVGEKLFTYVIGKAEADELLKFVRFLASGHPEDYILYSSYTLNTMSELDFIKLAEVRTFKQLSQFLKNTKYEKFILNYIVKSGDQIDFPLFESVLLKHLYKETFEIIKNNFGGETGKTLELLLSLKIELSDIIYIYRSKKYFGTETSALKSKVFGMNRFLSPKILERLINVQNDSEIIDILKTTKYSKFIKKFGFEDLDFFELSVMHYHAYRLIHSSIYPAVVMFCFIILSDIEIENITSIIEGIRYKLLPDEISNMLVLNDSERG